MGKVLLDLVMNMLLTEAKDADGKPPSLVNKLIGVGALLICFLVVRFADTALDIRLINDTYDKKHNYKVLELELKHCNDMLTMVTEDLNQCELHVFNLPPPNNSDGNVLSNVKNK